jgi:hypothetical protein
MSDSKSNYENSSYDCEHFIYDSLMPMIRSVEENQYHRYSDDMHDVFLDVFCMAYSVMRHSGWSEEMITEQIHNIDSNVDYSIQETIH